MTRGLKSPLSEQRFSLSGTTDEFLLLHGQELQYMTSSASLTTSRCCLRVSLGVKIEDKHKIYTLETRHFLQRWRMRTSPALYTADQPFTGNHAALREEEVHNNTGCVCTPPGPSPGLKQSGEFGGGGVKVTLTLLRILRHLPQTARTAAAHRHRCCSLHHCEALWSPCCFQRLDKLMSIDWLIE